MKKDDNPCKMEDEKKKICKADRKKKLELEKIQPEEPRSVIIWKTTPRKMEMKPSED